MTQNERFDILNDFLGWGNLRTARILFIALEPNIDWSEYSANNTSQIEELEKRLILRKKGYIRKSQFQQEDILWKRKVLGLNGKKRKFNITDQRFVYLSLELRRRILNTPTMYDAQDKNDRASYWLANDGYLSKYEFQSDVYALGAENENSWHREYRDLFGEHVAERSLYQAVVKNQRIKLLKKLIDYIIRKRDGYIFISHSDHWETFESPDFYGNHYFTQLNDYKLKHSGDRRIWLTYHPLSRDFQNKQVNVLIDEIVRYLIDNKINGTENVTKSN